MDKLAKQEACQLFIEQEIEEGLEKGKTAYLIGKDVAAWIEKLFHAKVNPSSIARKAQRIRTFVRNDITPQSDNEIEDNQEIKWGGKRKGSGRPPKFFVKEEQFRTSFSSENEWYTPLVYIEAARQVMGKIALDPATSEFGQKRIKATSYYTKEDDGLKQSWHGRIWLNPPYSQPLIAQFIKKTVDEYTAGNITEGIILTHNYTDTEWFHQLEAIAALLCFTKGRIKYEKEDGTIAAPTQGACFFYLGANGSKFKSIFKQFGFIR